jgi:hypothetical protein
MAENQPSDEHPYDVSEALTLIGEAAGAAETDDCRKAAAEAYPQLAHALLSLNGTCGLTVRASGKDTLVFLLGTSRSATLHWSAKDWLTEDALVFKSGGKKYRFGLFLKFNALTKRFVIDEPDTWRAPFRGNRRQTLDPTAFIVTTLLRFWRLKGEPLEPLEPSGP